MYLKFSKSWLGFAKVTFFGYEITSDGYQLTDERKRSIEVIPFPKNVKEMQRFLGSAQFFRKHVEKYSNCAA